MSRIKNSDCFKCGKWIAECDCYNHPYSEPYYGDQMEAMQEECSSYFESLQPQEQQQESPIPF